MRRALLLSSAAGILATPAFANSTTTYTYDALGRLVATSTTGTVNNGAAATTSYDQAGNRVSRTVTGTRKRVIVVPLNGITVIAMPD
jgi:YD repeat-containing protein